MVVDNTGLITINILGNAVACIDAIRVLDPATGIWYAPYPEGETAYCHAGQTCWVNMRLRNMGDLAGAIYLKVMKGETQDVIYNQFTSNLVPDPRAPPVSNPVAGSYADITDISFVMPTGNLVLTFEIGH